MWSRRRVRNAPTISSSPAQIRDTSDFLIPDVDAERVDQVVDRAGRHPVDVGLHHHRVQGLVDPPARLEDRREERALAQLRDAQLDVTGLGRQQPRPGPVAVGDPGVGALVAAGADLLGRFDLDQLLQHHPHRVADQIDTLTGTERVQQLGHGRLRQGHRWVLLQCATWRYTPRITPMAPPTWWTPPATPNPTTPGDAHVRSGVEAVKLLQHRPRPSQLGLRREDGFQAGPLRLVTTSDDGGCAIDVPWPPPPTPARCDRSTVAPALCKPSAGGGEGNRTPGLNSAMERRPYLGGRRWTIRGCSEGLSDTAWTSANEGGRGLNAGWPPRPADTAA